MTPAPFPDSCLPTPVSYYRRLAVSPIDWITFSGESIFRGMANIHCSRCGQDREQMAFRPFQNELGRRAYEEICSVCWAEWLKTQQQLINHYGLNLREPRAKDFLFQQMEQFLFSGARS
jgi:Fe-S cluster biosynthesis and repair protein YggX